MIAGREVAVAILGLLDAPPPEVVDIAAEAGFDAIGLRLGGGDRERPDAPGQYALIGDTQMRRATLERLSATGLRLLDVEVLRLQASTDPAALRPWLESAQVLGARYLNVVGLDKDEARMTETFAVLCAEAEPYGIRPVLEFMLMSRVPTVQHADRIVAAAGHPAGAVLVDPLHLQRSGGTPDEVAALATAHPDRYPYLQFCDALRAAPGGGTIRELFTEAVTNRLNPGDGELPLIALLRALPPAIAISVEGPVAALADRPAGERAKAAFAATKRVLEAAAAASAARAERTG